MIRTLRWSLLGLSLVGLTGCNAAATAYRFADWWIEYRIETWVDLDGTQEVLLQARVDDVLVWHQAAVMARVVELVDELSDAALKGTLIEVFGQREELIDELYYESVRPIALAVGEVFTTLTPGQVDELEEGLAAQLVKAREKLRDRARWGKKAKRLQGWIGDLTDEQIAIIEESTHFGDQSYRFECRSTRQRELVTALRASKPAESLGLIMGRWWAMRGCGDEADRARRAMRERWRERMARLEKSLSPTQRKTLSVEIRELADDLRELVADGIAP